MRTQIFEDRQRLREKQDKALREAISRVDDVERLYYDLKATAPSRVAASFPVEAKTSSPSKSSRQPTQQENVTPKTSIAKPGNSLGIGRRATNLPSNFDLTKIKLISQNDALLRRASRLRKELARHHGKMDLVLATAVAILEAHILQSDGEVGQKQNDEQLRISAEFEDLLPKALREGGLLKEILEVRAPYLMNVSTPMVTVDTELLVLSEKGTVDPYRGVSSADEQFRSVARELRNRQVPPSM